MGNNSYNAYYLGVQIGIGRVFASVNSRLAWTSIEYAKQNATALHAAGLLDSNNLAILTQIRQFVPYGESFAERSLLGEGGLHDTLVGITENFGLMRSPYGTIYHFGFWVGLAEAQASTGDPASVPHKQAALRKAKEYAALLEDDYRISADEIFVDADHPTLQRSRESWGEMFRQYA